MNIKGSIIMAAKIAEKATIATMNKYKIDRAGHEDDITGILIGRLDASLEGKIGGLTWNTSILKHRSGKSSQEKKYGADILIHVTMDSSELKYSKGILIQSKRSNPRQMIKKDDFEELKKQCRKMIAISPSSFVFNYATGGIRCASATKFLESENREIYAQCDWTMYRFFLELFRCPIGDPNISTDNIEDIPVPNIVSVSATSAFEQAT